MCHEKLWDYWNAQGLKIAAGATGREVHSFESLNSVILPPDFRDYILTVNGMFQDFENSSDQKGFAFWPLNQMTNAAQELANRPSAEPGPTNLQSYFIFADYMHRSWAYAINLGTDPAKAGHIIHVDTLRPKVVARSFTEFVNLYVQDAGALYTHAA
jgi:hypothetical protein